MFICFNYSRTETYADVKSIKCTNIIVAAMIYCMFVKDAFDAVGNYDTSLPCHATSEF